ncbi:MAG: glycine--tRNA ligase subunit beta [Candidatus Cloacimonetes bacterium]|nr:glycine--tRNA ligase subunit beta [Candidatus Cloacimonadota bacterium]
MHSFLFELGVEELPENVILPAIRYLQTSFEKILQEKDLNCGQIKIGSSPRRLSIWAENLPERQKDSQISKAGPSLSIAYTAEGELSPAGKGFLKKSGGSPEDIFIQKTEKGEFLAVSFLQTGESTIDILRTWILQSIPQIPWPKKMIWQSRDLAFSRPIRWIVALWDSSAIELDFFGVKAGNYSFGNRYLGLGKPIVIDSPQVYEARLKAAKVIVNGQKRRELIQSQCAQLFAGQAFKIKEDNRLLDIVTNLVEYPEAVVGDFDPRYLSLPEQIISSTISQNQKCFSVYDEHDRLANKFVFISNGNPQHNDIIRAGNEKVVAARLEDALWFFSEDSKLPLEDYLPKLQSVVFQSQMGSLADKTERLIRLGEYISKELGQDEVQSRKAMRIAKLCKADLVTLILGEKEFTKLQGYMGMQYALVHGEDPEIAQGIYEHYMPRGSSDGLPQTEGGAICAIADKLDTVAGIISVGLMPTGSQDPFALRRAAAGVVQILADRGWNLDLMALIDFALNMLQEKVKVKEDSATKVKSFFKQRISWLLGELGISYDVVASVMHVDISHLPDLIARARALQKLKSKDDFIRLVIGFKRVANIIQQEKSFAKLDPTLFESDAERDLHKALGVLSSRISEALDSWDYAGGLQRLVEFGKIIDNFFDKVLVNCDDEALRKNRYALLAAIRDEFTRMADLTLIVVENQTTGE